MVIVEDMDKRLASALRARKRLEKAKKRMDEKKLALENAKAFLATLRSNCVA